MFKFSRAEALQIVKAAKQARKQRDFAKLASLVNSMMAALPAEKRAEIADKLGMEKRGFIITGSALLAALPYIIPALISAGVTYWGMKQDDAAREKLVQEAETQQKALTQEIRGGLGKKLGEIDTLMQAAKQRAKQPPASPKPITLDMPKAGPQPPMPQPTSLEQPQQKSLRDMLLEGLSSMKEEDLSALLQQAQRPQSSWQAPSFMNRSSISPQFSRFMGGVQQQTPRYEPPEGVEMPGISAPPENLYGEDAGMAVGPPDEGFKFSSMPRMEKKAWLGNAIAALMPAIVAGLKSGGKRIGRTLFSKATRAGVKSGLKRGAQYLARPVGRAAAHSQSLAGSVLGRLPGETLKRTGKGLVQSSARNLASPQAAGKLGSNIVGTLARKTGKGALGLVSAAGTYGLGEEAGRALYGKSEGVNPTFGGMTDEQLSSAMQLLTWLQSTAGRGPYASKSTEPYVPESVAKQIESSTKGKA